MLDRREVREADFLAFVDATSAYLARTAYLLTGDRDAANDLVQETLARRLPHGCAFVPAKPRHTPAASS